MWPPSSAAGAAPGLQLPLGGGGGTARHLACGARGSGWGRREGWRQRLQRRQQARQPRGCREEAAAGGRGLHISFAAALHYHHWPAGGVVVLAARTSQLHFSCVVSLGVSFEMFEICGFALVGMIKPIVREKIIIDRGGNVLARQAANACKLRCPEPPLLLEHGGGRQPGGSPARGRPVSCVRLICRRGSCAGGSSAHQARRS